MQRLKKEIVVFSLTFPLSSCGPVKFFGSTELLPFVTSQDSSGNPEPSQSQTPVPTTPDVQNQALLCADESKLEKITHRIDFGSQVPDPVQKITFCQWNNAALGNIRRAGGKVTARTENIKLITVEPSLAICSLSLKSESQNVEYDDGIILSLNGYQLFTTWKTLNPFLKSSNGLLVYDWADLVGKSMGESSRNEPSCMGTPISCVIPTQQRLGPIEIDFGTADLWNLFTNVKQSPTWAFNLIAFGDDEPETDCAHSELVFNLELTVRK
jgi:hypothetical protein